MTTIIFKDNVFYADTQTSRIENGEIASTSEATKIYVCKNYVLTGCGIRNIILNMKKPIHKWFLIHFRFTFAPYDTVHIDLIKDTSSFMIYQDKTLTIGNLYTINLWFVILVICESLKNYKPVKGDWFIMGSGQQVAAKGLRLNLSPEEAIRVASYNDKYTNNIVDIVPV